MHKIFTHSKKKFILKIFPKQQYLIIIDIWSWLECGPLARSLRPLPKVFQEKHVFAMDSYLVISDFLQIVKPYFKYVLFLNQHQKRGSCPKTYVLSN